MPAPDTHGHTNDAREPVPTTLAEVFKRAARVHRKPDALNFKREGAWHSISSRALIEGARSVGLGLYALGVRRGDRVAVLSESRPEWVLTDAGCQLAGIVDVPIYPTQAPPQVSYILNDSGARVLFVQHRAAYERIAEAIGEVPALERIVFFDGGGVDESPRTLTLAELSARGHQLQDEQPNLIEELSRAVRAEDLATIIYTSGTTGEPKGVMLTQSNLVTNLIDSSGHLAFAETDVVLSVLPLSHVFERLGMYMYLHHGMSVYFAESVESIGANTREVRPTVMLCVPRLFEKILERAKERAAARGRRNAQILAWALDAAKRWARLVKAHETVPPLLELQHDIADFLVYRNLRAAVGGRMRLFVSGGAPLPEDLGYTFLGAGLPIVQGYGLTETSPVIAAGNLEENRIGTVGKPIKNVEVKIAEDGEILVKGPNVMRGYYNKPGETRAAFTEGGWFRTGDVGVLDADGYLRITDRKKELIKTSGGKYVAPQVVEQCIKRSRFVSQVVLVGDRRKFPAALVVPNWAELRAYAEFKGIAARTPEELCRDQRVNDLLRRQVEAQCAGLARYERVKRVALLPCELSVAGGELTPTLKVKRRVVGEKYRDVIERLYEEKDEG
ncbi:MAG: long-chain fatty acid--CoA ligase [Acidobacteria bacterium]|nr:long-chain fatty acid--CoA ligase [Acidobacteriota bacterium]